MMPISTEIDLGSRIFGTYYFRRHHGQPHRSLPSPRRFRSNICASKEGEADFSADRSRTARLRRLLDGDGILQGPCCHDGLSARLIEEAGFPIAFMSGFGVSAARLGAPDTNLLSYSEVLDQGRSINEATKAIPIIGDGDTGYGNALNVKRTVRGFAGAGFAGILIEDQVAPKSCGHVRGKRVVGRQEALARLRAAVDAREEGADILIVARTDARQAISLQEALWRVESFADAGADIVFIDALETREEMRAICSSTRHIPKMANMLEGGGKTPILAPAELEDMGFKLVAYPLSLLGVSIRAMQTTLTDLKDGRLPPDTALPSFADIQSAVGFPEYYAEAARYAMQSTSDVPTTSSSAASQEPVPPADEEAVAGIGSGGKSAAVESEVAISFEDEQASSNPNADRSASGDSVAGLSSLDEELRDLALDSDTEEAAGTSDNQGTTTSDEEDLSVIVVEPDTIVLSGRQQGESGGEDASTALRRARFLRVRITSVATGEVRLEMRLPAAFVDGIATVIPQVAGVDLEELIQQTQAGWTQDKPVTDFETGGERIQIFLDGLK